MIRSSGLFGSIEITDEPMWQTESRFDVEQLWRAAEMALALLEEPTPDVARKYEVKAALRRALGVK